MHGTEVTAKTAGITPRLPVRVRRFIVFGACMLALGFLTILWLGWHEMLDGVTSFFLFLVAVGGATIANATGVGGGVVFLPTFEYLGSTGLVSITAAQIVGMSFIIQCFGMTTGSLNWLGRIYDHRAADTGVQPRAFWRLLGIVMVMALPALLLTQAKLNAPPEAVLLWFKTLSICLGLTLLVTTLVSRQNALPRLEVGVVDYIALAALGLIGGVATAFFSVGVGELVALYLFIRNFPLITAAGVAVMASSLSVLTGVWHHIMGDPQPWGMLIFLALGCTVGGAVARHFAFMLGARRLKIFASLWITLSSAYLMWGA
ncbi:sulfite exporter TauE/SafE family protein [Kordiimonas sp.]|uniref:sulfite exporter TauE/SafE family protein n=1 Tax=Kordiimonas sp. TaxID=1970157 RepID=UPI003A921866